MRSNVIRLCLLVSLVSMFVFQNRAQAGETIKSAGDVTTVLLPATAGITSLLLQDYTGTKQLVEATALSLGVTLALKYTVNERRPNGEDYSFPSGHSAISFSSAEFIRKRYGWEYGLPAYAAATFVGYSRIESDQHYFHDVLAGALIGIGSSYLFTTPYSRLDVSGEAGAGYYGIKVGSTW
ncbi:MAG TPA: phosphatase PAP2 family protein [Geobacteraceae bacterium]|nr:phosphatase PAP2 family protein [Geobacteraceae bacterium]